MSHSVLIIVAHPKTDSLSFTIAKAYESAAKAAGKQVAFLDLYRDTYQQPWFTYDKDPYDRKPTDTMLYYQKKISDADEIVFVFPYWWGSMPAILKNFFDWNFSMGFAAVFENGRPKGLLSDKHVKVFTSTGTPRFLYTLTGANRRLKQMFKQQIIEFCGMRLDAFEIFGGIDANGVKVDKILHRVRALV